MDVLEFEQPKEYGIWIDRATFHFLQSASEIEHYFTIVEKSLMPT